MNTTLLRDALLVMQRHPERVDMNKFFDSRSDSDSDCPVVHLLDGGCSSVGCIAGHVVALLGRQGPLYAEEAAHALGITTRVADTLFYVSLWPEPFRSRYLDATSPDARMRVITDRIEYFIVTHQDAPHP